MLYIHSYFLNVQFIKQEEGQIEVDLPNGKRLSKGSCTFNGK